MYVSVVIPTYGRGSFLYWVLKCFERQTYDLSKIEIIIVNDGEPTQHEDSTIKWVESFVKESSLNIRYIWKKRNGYGAGECRNIGIQQARGDLILIYDDDVFLSPDGIEKHVGLHKQSDQIFVCGATYICGHLKDYDFKQNNVDFLVLNSIGKQESESGVSLINKIDMLKDVEQLNMKENLDKASQITSRISCLRKHLIKIGGFDSDYYGRYGCEDADLHRRLVTYGLKPLFRSDIKHYFFLGNGYHYPFDQRGIDIKENHNILKRKDVYDYIRNKNKKMFSK